MGVTTTAENRFRHVAFVTPRGRGAINLGAPRAGSDPTTRALCDDARGDDRGGGEDDADDAFLAALLFRAGLRALDYRPESLRRRLPACLRALRAQDAAHARSLVRRSAQLVPVAIDALLLGVTEFFRDAPTFDWLANHFRDLAATSSGDQALRVWSAGCSDGAELCSA